jgi:polysaccharide deacetylase family protein (PEP-CTERM system associated)
VNAPSYPRRHILTVAVEDYYQVGSFNRTVQRGQWHRFESRVERNTLRVLDLLGENGVQATFFTLGWIAEEFPELVREIAARGHEVASKGFWHRSIRRLTPSEFRDDLLKSREALEKASGQRVLGYRVADAWFRPQELWALEVLAQEGFAYDSSICPMFDEWSHETWRRVLHRAKTDKGEIWEVPPSTAGLLAWSFPIAGGNYYRQFPHRLMKAAFRHWCDTRSDPFVMYFQVWELDVDQPRIAASSLLTRLRHYRNLGKMKWVLEDYFKEARFESIAAHLHLQNAPVFAPAAETGSGIVPISPPIRVRNGVGLVVGRAEAHGAPVPVTLVVPCFNEELVLPYLSNTLEEVESAFADQYELHYVFVDDRSRDGTHAALERIFGGRPRCEIVRHSANRGVAQAILTGIQAAKTEIVCSIDCDCTYDPHQIGKMIPMLTDGVDLVTASPYHPQGRVVNVPEWRLVLSRTLSALYRRVLRTKLATYTSCFRVYRRSVMIDLPLRETGFLGIAEMLGVLDFQGRTIAECPAVLEVRMLGRSKMKLLRTILGHLRLLARFATRGLRTPRGTADAPLNRFEAAGRAHPGPHPVSEPALSKGKVKVHG